MAHQVRHVASGLDHVESVIWDRDRQVAYAGGEAGQIYRVRWNGEIEVVANTGGSVLGLAQTGPATLVACDVQLRAIVEVDVDTGRVRSLIDRSAGLELAEPNGMAPAPDGGFYFTDSGAVGAAAGVVYYVGPQGLVRWCEQVPNYPNGCWAARDHLLVVESGAQRLVRVPIEAGHRAGKPQLVADLPGTFPDGVTCLADGTIYVGCYRPDRVFRIAPGRGPAPVLDDPFGLNLPSPTGLAPCEIDGQSMLLIASYGSSNLVALDLETGGSALRSATTDADVNQPRPGSADGHILEPPG